MAKALGKNGPLDLVPPDPGTEASMVLTITGSVRYCVKFGTDGIVRNRDAEVFEVKNPTAQGCPP